MKTTIYLFLIIMMGGIFPAAAQVAANPPYALEQTVIASGGGTSADSGNQFSLTGSIGQSIAGTTSNSSPYTIAGGFFAAAPLAPTAAGVSISGRVLTNDGKGLINAFIVLILADGQMISARSTTFGEYRFDDVRAGQIVVLSVISKRFRFASQILSVNENVADYNLIALSPN